VVEEVLESARSRYLADRGTQDVGDLDLIEGVEPPVPGKRFMNSLGMDFVPLPDEQVMAAVFEVRVKEFAYFAKQRSINWQKPGFRQASSHCAIGVSYDQAVEFCDWLTELERESGALLPNQRYRLPTDAEWSSAVGLASKAEVNGAPTGAEQEVFPWGAQWPPPSYIANLDDKRIAEFRDRFTYTAPVGGRPKNNLGISDLAGNAAEWCSDEFPPGSGSRMVRGSSWLDSSREVLQSGYRKHFPPNASELDLGFRCFLQVQ
jgi:formylglycine-generating enzyme required for sulfatase activity